jgi:hypothetical protein
MLASLKNENIEDIPEFGAPRACDLSAAVFSYHVHELKKKGLAFVSVYGEGGHYGIAPPGSGWLIEHNQMPE